MLDFINPGSEISHAAGEALRSLSNQQATGLVVRVHQATEVELPPEMVPLLIEILAQMANGNGIRVVPVHAELTTQQAADLLNTSQAYLIKLLETGAIPFHFVGIYQRVKLNDLLAYRRKWDEERRAILDLSLIHI